jgi:DNA-binding MarR family transcriptional regulator
MVRHDYGIVDGRLGEPRRKWAVISYYDASRFDRSAQEVCIVTAPDKKAPARARPLADSDYARLAEFRYLLRHFLAFSEAAAEEAGLTPQQHQALLAIKGFPGSSRAADAAIGELAERLGIRHHSAVGLVDRLAAKGLVRRHEGLVDRRRVLIALTPKAETLLAGLTLTHRDELRRLAPLLRQILKQL